MILSELISEWINSELKSVGLEVIRSVDGILILGPLFSAGTIDDVANTVTVFDNYAGGKPELFIIDVRVPDSIDLFKNKLIESVNKQNSYRT